MYKLFSFICLLLFVSVSLAKETREDLATAKIPKELKKEAFAVIRDYVHYFEYQNPTTATEKVTKTITILNKKGEKYANFKTYTDQFRKLTKFNAIVYDEEGKEKLKFKKSKLKTSEWSSNLSSDDLFYFLDINFPSFPYTIVIEYEKKWRNGILFFPYFMPQTGYNLSVEKSKYTLLIKNNRSIQYSTNNLLDKPKETVVEEQKTYSWEANQLKAVKSEAYDLSLEHYVPYLWSAPKEFSYDGFTGKITTAADIALWQKNLNKNKNTLSPEFVEKIKTLTAKAQTKKEKVKLIYDFLGNSTRYESIQLGIGGHQPIAASEVCRTGFGDCKGLTNYMQAMLQSIGITSYYTIIRSHPTEKKLANDFTGYLKANHIILQVPLPNDTLWLECTNPNIPLGYIHQDIAGHDAFVVTLETTTTTQLPDYIDSLNTDHNITTIELSSNGAAKALTERNYQLKQYENIMFFSKLEEKKQKDVLKKNIRLANTEIKDFYFEEKKEAKPSFKLTYNWETPSLGVKMGSRLFIPANLTRKGFAKYRTEERKHAIKKSFGYKDIDSTTIKIPHNYEVESLPKPLNIQTKFGRFTTKIHKQDNKLIIHHELVVKSGEWKADAFKDFTDFLNKISKAYGEKIVLKSK